MPILCFTFDFNKELHTYTKHYIKMKTLIVDSWTKVPFIGIQVSGFNTAIEAFNYADNEYASYGYKTACFCTDLKMLFITK